MKKWEIKNASYTLCYQLFHEGLTLSPTNWGEFSGTEGTRDVVNIGWRQNLSITALASFSSICDILLTGLYAASSTSLKKRDRGWRRGGAGEDWFTVDYRE